MIYWAIKSLKEVDSNRKELISMRDKLFIALEGICD